MVDVTEVKDQWKLLRALWDHADYCQVDGRICVDPYDKNKAREQVYRGGYCHIVCNKMIDTILFSKKVDPTSYNKMYGVCKFEMVLDCVLREQRIKKLIT
jgi:hypothetical protein